VRRQRIEDLGRQPARAAHAFEPVWAMQLDNSAFRFDPVVGSNRDVLSHRH